MGVRRLESHGAGMLKEETYVKNTIGKLAAIARARTRQGGKEVQNGE